MAVFLKHFVTFEMLYRNMVKLMYHTDFYLFFVYFNKRLHYPDFKKRITIKSFGQLNLFKERSN